MIGALGLIHVVNFDGSNKMDMIPVDACVKGMIVASYKVWLDKESRKNDDVPVYNATSLRCVVFSSLNETPEIFDQNPSKQLIGIPSVTFSTCIYYVWILRIFRHLIPALIIDALLRITNNQPK